MGATELGTFLKARRGHVQPGDLGIRTLPGRRVSGLRREEVAMLGGLSVDYYTRLEQGRERNPSPGVLNALAAALDMDDDLREHLFRLAGLAPTSRARARDVVDDATRELLEAWVDTPALVINRQLDVLALNALAAALYDGFARVDNLVRMTFLDPFGRRFFSDWERATSSCVANLRLALGFPGADGVRALIAEVHEVSAEFRALWSRHDVRGKSHEAKSFQHPDVGELDLEYSAFDIRSSPGQQLVVYRATAGSPSADKLRLLGSLAATAADAR